jgi:hypothetical protein
MQKNDRSLRFPLNIKLALFLPNEIILGKIISAGEQVLKVEDVEFLGLHEYKIEGISYIDRHKVWGFSKLEEIDEFIQYNNKQKLKLIKGGKN